MNRPMAVIGLTGGIGAGKSTVAERFAERGVPVIDADQVAREVVEPGEPALELIRAFWGDRVIREDGTLDRQALGNIVFASREQLERLNQITHPQIMSRVGQRLVDLQRAGHAWAVYEAALILENDLAPGLTELIVVICDPATQVRRMMERSGFSEEHARERLANQTDNATRRERADIVIDNDGTLEELMARTDEVIDELNARYGVEK
ncbi:MAG: dephospho-CoA kinase [Myxococcota bacterium]